MKVLLYYKYITIPDPAAETEQHREMCQQLGLKGRIIIGSEGINGTCSGSPEAIENYKKLLDMHPLFSGISFKESVHHEHPFRKLFVRCRPEIVTLRQDVGATEAAPHISPSALHELLERGEDVVLIDMRNDYEAAIGRFRGAVTLTMENFRDLPNFLGELNQYKNRTVITYCTGGIRCERASALLQKNGFTDVRQLEGGIVRYCEEFPDGFFEGSLFVFDARLSMRFPGKRPHIYLTKCAFCSTPSDHYIDCHDSLCSRRLTLCCEDCEKIHKGYCPAHQAVVA